MLRSILFLIFMDTSDLTAGPPRAVTNQGFY